jgi:hypothetical protein
VRLDFVLSGSEPYRGYLGYPGESPLRQGYSRLCQEVIVKKTSILSLGNFSVLLFVFGIILFMLYASYFDHGPYSIYDDSFISYRYADNLVHGSGLVFNPNERVEGYTNFLWTVLLAAGISLGADVIWFSKIISVGVCTATLWVTFRLGQEQLDDLGAPRLRLSCWQLLPVLRATLSLALRLPCTGS